MAALYADENFPRQGVLALRALGHDVLTAGEAGNAGQGIPDEEVLAFATRAGRAVLTINRRDFIRLHERFERMPHEGIIVCTQDGDVEAQARRIHEAIAAAGSLSGRLLRVNRLSAP
ncbi:MAG TPA: DUF5615 family PIN-like protein [Polyangia bacterium]|jgi:predicted nuclease of predicted toxin-antitoxin system|nr:DUF5615 family PIN-like protein [Polyangia bacterium]